MNSTEKKQIKEALNEFCQRSGGQNKAANKIKAVSAALISQVLNENWENISEAKWRSIAAQIGFTTHAWQVVETTDYGILTKLLEDAQANSQVYAVVSPAGSGKSQTFKIYEKNNLNAYMVQCNEFWNRKAFLQELLSAMGRDYTGLNINDMMVEVVRVLKQDETPILLLDEFDKVTDQVLYFFITLYNQLEDHCAIVMCATDHLEKRIRRGLKLNKKGYKEIYSRIGRKFIELNGLTQQDVMRVCHANGITDPTDMKDIWDECEGDLRRVKRKIHALKLTH